MPFDDLLGRITTLSVRRFGPPGAFLVCPEDLPIPDPQTVLLPRGEVPEGLKESDTLEVFVYLDSEDRPTATTGSPTVTLGEVAFMPVTDVTRIGAFVDWGLRKELMIPFAEQTRALVRGDTHPVGLIRDRTGRLAGTMRIRELLQDDGDFKRDEWVEGEAWRDEPGVGVFVIVERRFLGLVPEREPHDLHRGQRASFRVSHVWPDGRFELSLRGLRHEELASDGAQILAALTSDPTLRLSDHASPEELRRRFGLSRKAFKRAVGGLLKARAVTFDGQGFLVVAPVSPQRTNVPR